MEVGEPREGGGEEVEGEETEAGGGGEDQKLERGSWRGVKRKKKKKEEEEKRRGEGADWRRNGVWCVMAILSRELRTTGSVVPVTRGAAELGHGAEVPGPRPTSIIS